MIEVLAKIPVSSTISPPEIGCIKKTVEKFVTSSTQANEVVLSQAKIVRAAVTRLLQFEWDPPRERVQYDLTHISILAEGRLNKTLKDHRVLSNELLEIVDDLDVASWKIKLKERVVVNVATDAPESASTYADWKNADIGWLANPEYFSPSSCPKMKVGSVGVYDSSEEYLETTHRLWVAMTFAEGHGALAPHCSARSNSGYGCGNSLWCIPENANTSSLRCRTKNCREPVEFACRIANHDALCGNCAMRSVDRHKKGPEAGKNASTHIYDCRVKRVGEEGILYLTEFKSRNPPPTDIHWRTTKRLSSPNLVGVVKTRSRGAELQDRDLIKWGECVNHGHSRDEDRRRKNGELAINISTIVDFDPDYFEENSSVVVIDCMAFVPEWIPVLKAIESQQKIRLPFDNGKDLNLVKQEPVPKSFFWEDFAEDVFSLSSSSKLMDKMIDESTLEPIREIRRDDKLRDSLRAQLDSLVNETTLDKGQLMSFVDSLRYPCHLTQGPPGTGKSYLGVVLVRALMIIRELWVRKTNNLSSPPILVLSYKNHAIDEFLVDLVKAEPRRLSPSKLIRIGGQCKDQRLALYSERSTFQADPSVKQKRSSIQMLNDLHASIKVTLESGMASFLAHRHTFMLEDDPRIRRKIILTAAQTIMEMIARHTMLEQALIDLKDQADSLSPDNVIQILQFLKLDNATGNYCSSPEIQRYCQKDHRDAAIPCLSSELKHYENIDHWGDVLVMWLAGKVPLPPCSFTCSIDGKECGKRSFDPSVALCDSHRCTKVLSSGDIPGASGRRCDRACDSERGKFCLIHKCSLVNCSLENFGGSQYCRRHGCKRCVELGCQVNLALERPPRNYCEKHPACLNPSCVRFRKDNGMYCEEHDEIRCLALTKKKKPCKGTPISRMMPYCRDHKHLASVMDFGSDSEDESSVESVESDEWHETTSRTICSGMDNRGRPCKETALPGKRFCYSHDDGDTNSPLSGDNGEESNRKEVTPIGDAEGGSEKHTAAMDSRSNCSSADSVASTNETFETATGQNQGNQPALDEFDELEVEEGENQQHLRDVFEIVEDELLFDVENGDASSASEKEDQTGTTERVLAADAGQDPSAWTWTLSGDDRWTACQTFLAAMRAPMNTACAFVKAGIVAARKDYQQAVNRAKAKAYESKSIIGGTMVGCISRLESIRATRPFAVVVEEASEVLEPLLFSCLTESTIKLEMIGDHRQLQPSVMSRYDFELHNKINVSMFQRLIEAPSCHEVPSTVLSVQRRMRSNICDLTRRYYADVVEIEDDQRCMDQRIGSRLSPAVDLKSSTNGREVPGICPHVFLWTHSGAQKRSSVGISRMNPTEAEMASSLAGYLVECGVPKQSIAIITPYKGQLMEIRKYLLQHPKKLLSRNSYDMDVCRLSTVDRFQGDEEDIVICSLVVDENSKTAFVKLVNRMVVLLSRARIGMYVLGNLAYFQNERNVPRHWQNTLELLEQNGKSDSKSQDVEGEDLYCGPCTGSSLPLCCPIHRNISVQASGAKDLRLGFCTEPCGGKLTCGHRCTLSCHWPTKAHIPQCRVELQSPCDDHPRVMMCHELYSHVMKTHRRLSFDKALPFFQCSEKVQLELPCKHTVLMSCWEKKKILENEISMPVCNKKSPIPFKFQGCEHEKEVSCKELSQFIDNPKLIKCEKEVEYEPLCGHSVHMPCWLLQEYNSGRRTFDCNVTVTALLPRCGHSHKIACNKARSLEVWEGTRCQEVGRVLEGTVYGPVDYPCREKVLFVRPCNHNLRVPCHEAMLKSCSFQACREKVDARRPDCGHKYMIQCSKKSILENVSFPEPFEEIIEGNTVPKWDQAHLLPPCACKIKLKRKCGHVEEMECSAARKPLLGCKVEVQCKSPLCGHDINIPCSWKGTFDTVFFWKDEVMNTIQNDETVPKGSQLLPHHRSIDLQETAMLQACSKALSVELPCGHSVRIQCKDLLGSMDSLDKLSRSCEEMIRVELDCGHYVRGTCKEVQLLHAGQNCSLQCHKKRLQTCWNYASCGKKVSVGCAFKGEVACCSLSKWQCPNGTHEYDMKLCSQGIPGECPGCLIDQLKSQAQHPASDVEVVDSLKNLFATFPAKDVEMLEPKQEYEQFESQVLEQQIKCQEDLDPWSRRSVELRRIPCYRVLNRKNTHKTSFDPETFVKKNNLNGLLVKILCSDNLQSLADNSSDSCTLLVGYASIVKVKKLFPQKMPPGKQKSQLAKELWCDQYDSLLYKDSKGMESLIVWSPYPVKAVVKVKLTSLQLKALAELLEGFGIPEPNDCGIEFCKPENLVVVDDTSSMNGKEDNEDEDDDGDDQSFEDKVSLAEIFFDTKLQGRVVESVWDGGIASAGLLDRRIEMELLKKMKFVSPDAKPFAALTQLQALLESESYCPLLHLLIAAENIAAKSIDDALTEFDLYLGKTFKRGKSLELHPWSIIVAARLDANNAKQLLVGFAKLFPRHLGFLSKDEQEIVNGIDLLEGNQEQSWTEKFKNEWSQLKNENHGEISFDATDELLELIGLRKVKQESLRLWKAALQLKKMDSETRRENPIPANYCFLGNPGKSAFSVLHV